MVTQAQATEIAQTLIHENFPELSAVWIKYAFPSKKRSDAYMSVRREWPGYVLNIDREIMTFSVDAFKGCLAHELAHIYFINKQSFFKILLEKFRSQQTNETMEERAADSLVIERNLGNELYQYHKEHGKEYKKYNSSEGLTRKEIKKILIDKNKSIKK